MHSTPSPEQVQSASPEDLILMLFEGAIRFGNEADEALVRGDRAAAAGLIGRVRAIVEELDRGLNPAAGSITPPPRRDLRVRPSAPRSRRLVDSPTLREVIADLQVLCEAWTALVAERRGEALEDSHAPALA